MVFLNLARSFLFFFLRSGERGGSLSESECKGRGLFFYFQILGEFFLSGGGWVGGKGVGCKGLGGGTALLYFFLGARARPLS